jgi:MFS family permease
MMRWLGLRLLRDMRLAAILALLVPQGFAVTINGIAAPWMMQSFGLRPAGLARMFALVSLSAAGAFMLGRMFDSLGRGRVLRWCVIGGAVSAAAAALSGALVPFVIFDTALVATASAIVAGAPVVIAEVLDPSDRATGQGLGGLALGAGAGLCIVLMPALRHLALSWRWMLWIAGLPLLAAPWLLRGDWDKQFWRPGDERDPASSSLSGALFRGIHGRRIAVLMTSSVCSTAAISASRNWGYFHSISDAGLSPEMASGAFLFAGVTALSGFPLGAMACDRVGRVWTVAGFGALVALAMLFCFLGPPGGYRWPVLWLAAGFAVLGAATNGLIVGGTAAATELFPTPVRATAVAYIALAGAAGSIAGQALVAAMAAHVTRVATVVAMMGVGALASSALFLGFVDESRGLSLEA